MDFKQKPTYSFLPDLFDELNSDAAGWSLWRPYAFKKILYEYVSLNWQSAYFLFYI